MALVGSGALDHSETVVERGIMERAMIVVEVVGPLSRLVLGKHAFFAPVTADHIDPATLHEVTRKASAGRIAVEFSVCKVLIDKAEETAESRFITAMRGGS